MPSEVDEFLAALTPIVASLGATVVPRDADQPGDRPIHWKGEQVASLRVAELHGALERLVATTEQGIGTRLADMDRTQKQVAVRQLDEQGAFLLRGAVEEVASMMDVSKVTLYNYLNAIERDNR